MNSFGIIILAAGPSSRLGEPKQLLSYQHKTLLDHTIEAAIKAAEARVVVILGENYQLIKEHIHATEVKIIHNPDWQEGMGSAIRTGLSAIRKENQELAGVILAVCDQPFLTDRIFKGLIAEAGISDKGIVASSYAQTLGTPVLFDKAYFGELAGLKGKEGAKTLLGKYETDVTVVPFENGEIDIDTPDDYRKLINKTEN
jgi:molybdenum cofactor cytidylyltransferase